MLERSNDTGAMSHINILDDTSAHGFKQGSDSLKVNWWDSMKQEESMQDFKENLDMLLCKRTETIQGHLGSVIAVAIHSQENLMVTGGFDSTIRIWDILKDTCIKSIKEHHGCINSIEILYPFQAFISVSSDGFMAIWSFKTFTLLAKVSTEHVNGISDLVIAKDFSRMWTSGYDGDV